MTNPLEYKSAPVPEDCEFKISPSAFYKFVESIHKWYRDEVLDENLFSHNTSSVLGTCVHYCAEQVALGNNPTKDYMFEYIDSFEEDENYNRKEVKDNIASIAETLINQFVIPNINNYLLVEEPICFKVKDKVYASGTIDGLLGSKNDCDLIDYKTYNSKTKPRVIPSRYRYPQLVYCWILNKLGYKVRRFKLIYINRYIHGGVSEKTGKPLKSYPPEVTVLSEEVTQESLDFIESLLNLCVDTLSAHNKYPELRHVIWHDYRLKEENK